MNMDTTSGFFGGPRISPVLLWRDGTAMVSNRGWSGRRTGTLEEASTHFKNSADSIIIRHKRSLFSWGRFRLNEDSIRVQVMRCALGLATLSANRYQ